MKNDKILQSEIILIKKLFNLQEVIDLQIKNDIQIMRSEDYQYLCSINKKVYATSITPIGALVIAIKNFKEKNKK